MKNHINPTQTTRDAWDFIAKNVFYLMRIAALPLLLCIASEGFVEIYYGGAPTPLVKASSDVLYALLEALWGVRWLRYLLEPPRQNKYFMAPFRFGRHELRYAFYSLLVLTPIVTDDLILGLNIPESLTWLMFAIMIAFVVLSVRFEFIFPAIALSHRTSLRNAWKKAGPYWGRMLISYLQSLVIFLPIVLVVTFIGFLIFLGIWSIGLVDVSGWILEDGFTALFNRSPYILGIYIVTKETVWLILQAFLLTIAGLYYHHAAVKLTSKG